VAVLLDARGAQAGKAVVVDGGLPGQEFFDRQRITLAGLLEAEKPATHGSDDFGLPANHPAPRVGRRQIGDRQGAAIGADDVFSAGSYQIGHWTLYINSRPYERTVARHI
jgi:hypothetical protein